MSKKLLAAVAAPFAASGAFAAAPAIVVTDVVSFIESLGTPIAAIGAAYLIIAYSIKGWKLMRGV